MKVIENASLFSYNSFHLEAKAKTLLILEKEEEIAPAFSHFYQSTLPFLVLGGGSNTLFSRDFPGIIFQMGNKGMDHQEKDDYFEVNAQAGENWNDLVQYCLKFNIGGLENLSLIPGTVGAAPVQNIGAYGVELKDYFYRLKAFHINRKEFRWFSLEECGFGYRNSVFKTDLKGQYIISSLSFRFPKKQRLHTEYGIIKQELDREGIHTPNISDISRIVSRIRQEKLPDPKTIGNAGSFFKNPVVSQQTVNNLLEKYPDIVYYPHEDQFKLAAGWMIEKSGWKGKSKGQVGTWKNQALVLVNLGGATGSDILDFAKTIIQSVFEKFQVNLEMEVNII